MASTQSAFIALDWGTSSFRAYQVSGDGAVLNEVTAPNGILAVQGGAFDAALEAAIGTWPHDLPVMASGMITSRQGWIEVPYVPCPAGLNEIAKGIIEHRSARGRRIHFVPGLCAFAEDGAPDVLRGEETQVLGAARGGVEHFLTPGTHNKWIDVRDGIIERFATYMTGEAYAVLKAHSILGRLMTGETDDDSAFMLGVSKGLADAGGLLHQLFSVRTLGLFERMRGDGLASYLSGLLIGSEIGHAMSTRSAEASYHVLGSALLAERYISALKQAGIAARAAEPNVAVQGLVKLARHRKLIA
jgi:2-dehydro-3-deoxygalactonokinase